MIWPPANATQDYLALFHAVHEGQAEDDRVRCRDCAKGFEGTNTHSRRRGFSEDAGVVDHGAPIMKCRDGFVYLADTLRRCHRFESTGTPSPNTD